MITDKVTLRAPLCYVRVFVVLSFFFFFFFYLSGICTTLRRRNSPITIVRAYGKFILSIGKYRYSNIIDHLLRSFKYIETGKRETN